MKKRKLKRMAFAAVAVLTLWSQMGYGAHAIGDTTPAQQSTKSVTKNSQIGQLNVSKDNVLRKKAQASETSKLQEIKSIDLSKVNDRQMIVSFMSQVHNNLSIDGIEPVETANATKNQGVQIFKVSQNADFVKVLNKVRNNPDVEYAEPDYLKQLSYIPTDEKISDQWYLKNIGMYQAWDVSKGSESSVIVAVLDSGINSESPDLKGKVLKGYDFVNNDDDPSDDEGHGSSVTGIIAANANMGLMAGVDFNAQILPIKVADAKGELSNSAIVQGIYYAIDHGANIINMSFAGSEYDQAIDDALYDAHKAGIVLVAAAGNDATSTPSYPASDNNVISVSATDENNQVADFSNYGDWVDVAAPGTNILSITNSNSEYTVGSGTSFSAPIVSGIAALLKSEHPSWSPDEIEWAIEKGAGGNWNSELGFGHVNAYSALTTPLSNTADESDDTVVLQSGQAVQKSLSKPNEMGFYQFKVDNAAKVTVKITGGSSYLNLAGSLFVEKNNDYNDVATIDDQDKGQDETYTFSAEPGTYDLTVYDDYDHWSTTPYTVQVNVQGLSMPTASLQSGTYDQPFEVTLKSDDNLPIKYTLDGTTPSATHGLNYTGPIQIKDTTTLKAVAIGQSGVSQVVTYSYFFEKAMVGDVDDPATQIPVLMYHGLLTIAENTTNINNSNYVQVEHFEEQMKYLADHHYHTVTAKEMDDFLSGKMELPRKSVMIQFDDGLRSVYRYAYPIMQKYGLHGVANIITGRTDGDYGADWDPTRNQYMTHDMLDTISAVFDLESHTDELHFLDNNVSRFITSSPANIFADLKLSMDKLEKYGNVNILAYPFGQYNNESLNIVKEVGFSQAYTIKKGYAKSWDDPYQLNRIAVYPSTTLTDFEKIVSDTVEPIFTDIPLSHPNFGQTFWLYSHHIIKGFPDGHFAPNVGITRAQSAKMLVQALGIKVPDQVTRAPFTDIPLSYGDQYLVRAVTALKDEGIFNGDQGKFRPNEILTREQMATVLVNTFHWHSDGKNVEVKDLKGASGSHQENIEILAQKGITILPNGDFSPHGATKRIHLASFLYKAMHL